MAWDDIDADPRRIRIRPGAARARTTSRQGRPPRGKRAGERAGADDVDEVAIERAVTGDGIGYHQLTLPERAEAVRRLTACGRSLRDIAGQLDTATRTVSRRRAAQRAAQRAA